MSSDADIADIYPLSPMQEGMLFHAQYDPQSRVYFEQATLLVEGPLDPKALQRAWEQAVERHTILRTAFVWEGLDEPLQVVQHKAPLPFEHLDWRGQSEAQQREGLERRMEDERRRGFDLAKAPLMRLALVRLGEERWQLLWSFSHLLLDGWSIPVLLGEVFALYEAHVLGKPHGLPAPRPYRDYVALLQGRDKAEAEAHWRARLKGFHAPTPIPLREPAGAKAQPFEAPAELRASVGEAATQALQAMAREQRITLNTIVQGAWALLLSRYAREDDVAFGATVSGRPPELQGVDRMVGLFINTLPVRVQVEKDAGVAAWLRKVHQEQLETLHYEHSHLVQIQGWSDVQRGEPLFHSIIVFENYPAGGPGDGAAKGKGPLDQLRVHPLQVREMTNYPLTVVAGVMQGKLQVTLNYDRRQFQEDAVRRMLGHVTTLLEGIAKDPHQPVRKVPWLPADERATIEAWNRTRAPMPEKPVHHLVEEHARRAPQKLAVASPRGSLTYGELNARANQLARHLRSLGVGPDSLVAVMMERGPDNIIALLAVLKAGGAYAPIDPTYPEDRIAFMLADTRSPLVLTTQGLRGMVPQGTKALSVDTEWAQVQGQPTGDLPPAAGLEHVAYCIYTSGSTGTPKGAMVEHRGLANFVRWHDSTLQVTEQDRASYVASLSFDGSAWELWPHLCAGASLHIPEEDTRLDPARLLAWMAEEKVTIAFLTTTLAMRVVEQPAPPGLALRHLLAGGERMPALQALPPYTFHNVYGPTETTIAICTVAIAEGHVGRPPPIGTLLPNCQAHVLDEDGREVPVEVPGELFIGGVCVGRGYHHRPELTAQRYLADPARGKLYRTGDLVRWLPDGSLDFVGRIDFQVKIRGLRIELGEIEARLREHPALREAVVVARGEGAGQRLVAYVVGQPAEGDAANGHGPAASELREFLRRTLPDYMVPSAFVALPQLPTNANGKVDRRALPEPPERPEGSDYVAPRNPTEQALAAIWQEVLKVERVGVHDSFFELGGHSLLAAQIAGKVQESLGVEVPLRLVFEAVTVAALAEQVEALKKAPAAPSQPPAPGPIKRVARTPARAPPRDPPGSGP